MDHILRSAWNEGHKVWVDFSGSLDDQEACLHQMIGGNSRVKKISNFSVDIFQKMDFEFGVLMEVGRLTLMTPYKISCRRKYGSLHNYHLFLQKEILRG